MLVPVTAVYAALSGVLLVVLAYLVVRQRRASSVGMGAGENAPLERAIRAHGNAVENFPIALLLLLVLELNGAAAVWLHAFGAALLLARGMHAFGLSTRSGRSFGRFYGTALTWLVILGLAVANGVVLLPG